VPSLRGPCFAAVEQHRDADGFIDSNLGGCDKATVEEETMQQSDEGG